MDRQHLSLPPQVASSKAQRISRVGLALLIVALCVHPSRAQTVTSKSVTALPGQEPAVHSNEMLPPAKPAGTDSGKNQGHDGKDVPLTLDTIFRLAESHNARVGLARARVAEACAVNCLANKNWLPNLYIGSTYYRHEGGISLEDGTLLRSSFGVLFGGIDINSKLDLR